jgi:sugar transferase (PEP-CTERM/EpsH1 system associated)
VAHLLLLSQRIPYPPNKGEKIRTFQILKHWSKSHDIHLGCFIDDENDWQYRKNLDAYCKSTKYVGLSSLTSYLKAIPALLTGGALSVAFFHRKAMQHWTDYMLATVKPEIIVIFSSAMAQYLQGKNHGAKVIIMDFMDVDSDKWVQYAPTARFPMNWIYRREGRTLLEFDKQVTLETDASIYVTPNEVELFDRLAPETKGKSIAIANGVNLDYFSPDNDYIRTDDMAEGPSICFTGVMNYRPNVDAVSWMRKQVLPIIWKSEPNLKFYIVGSSPNDEVKSLASDKVIVTGRVEDVRPYVHFSSAVVTPLRIARGIQNKVLEAMSMQKIVVVTPHALEGIAAEAGKDLLLGTTAEEFAAQVLVALKKSKMKKPSVMAKNARQLTQDKYSWQSKFKEYDHLIAKIMKAKK